MSVEQFNTRQSEVSTVWCEKDTSWKEAGDKRGGKRAETPELGRSNRKAATVAAACFF
jgi:hypothetical protein